ncbi:MAG: UDP-glucose 4-epimerase GalE [Siculibacillus sp.]
MTTLVTGGCGYIGSHLVWALADRGEDVVVLDDLSAGFSWAIPAQVRLVRGDVGDRALLDELLGGGAIDAVVHFAGSLSVPESVGDPLGYYFNNTVKTRELIAAAVRHGVRNFVFSSTAAVYGAPEIVPVPEDARLDPVSPYGSSKLMIEIMLRDTAVAHDFRYTALRYFNVAGADSRLRTGQASRGAAHIIKVSAECLCGLRPGIQVFGTDYPTPDGTGVRDYIHVSDLADVHVLALDRLRAGGDSLVANCGYGKGFSVWEVISAVERVTGRKLPVTVAPRRPGDPPTLIARVDRIHRAVDWTPKWSDLDAIVAHAIAWEEILLTKDRS